MTDEKHPNPSDKNQQEAKKILDRVARESETVATSSMARTSDQFGKLVKEKTGASDEEDPIEILGKRIGRGLGWIAVICLVVYLLATYVIK